jgi:nitrate reductase assembly molybdenum cofactor insertion protein NarJ
MAARDDIQRVAAALERPRRGYVKRLEQTRRALAARSSDAAHQLGMFADRVAELTIDELGELYDETFRADEAAIAPLVQRLVRARTLRLDASAALMALAPLLDRLEAERNPHAHAVRALCCVLRRSAR